MKRWMTLLMIGVLAVALTGCTRAPMPSETTATTATTATAVPSDTVTTVTEATKTTAPTTVATAPTNQPAAGEIRAVWVPYMEMQTLLSAEDPTAAFVGLMEDCVSHGINTVYLHVRANSDAYYASSVFSAHPSASAHLQRGFDPLRTAVREGHARGIQVHAWVNPYRIGADRSAARCEDVFSYNNRWYYVPTSEAARRLIVDGVREIVQGYDVDGIQFDDYFYPEGAVQPQVRADFEQNLAVANGQSLADARREAVSTLVREVYAVCHERDGCVFTVSPSYDVKRNREQMYADVTRWAATAGYVDVLCPQLYVGNRHQYAPFEKELSAWSAMQRDASVSLVAGLAFYKTGMSEDRYAGTGATEWANGGDIIARQILETRRRGWRGAALYSHQTFTADGDRAASVVSAELQAIDSVWNP